MLSSAIAKPISPSNGTGPAAASADTQLDPQLPGDSFEHAIERAVEQAEDKPDSPNSAKDLDSGVSASNRTPDFKSPHLTSRRLNAKVLMTQSPVAQLAGSAVEPLQEPSIRPSEASSADLPKSNPGSAQNSPAPEQASFGRLDAAALLFGLVLQTSPAPPPPPVPVTTEPSDTLGGLVPAGADAAMPGGALLTPADPLLAENRMVPNNRFHPTANLAPKVDPQSMPRPVLNTSEAVQDILPTSKQAEKVIAESVTPPFPGKNEAVPPLVILAPPPNQPPSQHEPLPPEPFPGQDSHLEGLFQTLEPPKVSPSDRPAPFPPVIPPASPTDGTPTAKSDLQMKKTANERNPAPGKDLKLPQTATLTSQPAASAVPRAASPTADDGSPLDIHWTSSSVLSILAGPSTEASPTESSTPLADKTSIGSIEQKIVHAAVELKRLGTESLSVVIRPDHQTEMHLTLVVTNGQIEVEAKVQGGDTSQFQSGWGDLQQNLAQQGIRLRPMEDSHDLGQQGKGNHSDSYQPQDEESKRRGARALPFMDETLIPQLKVSPRTAAARRLYESWA